MKTHIRLCHFLGDSDNLRSVSDIYFFTLGNDNSPVNLTISLNSTGIALNESVGITAYIKNADGEDISGSVDIYEDGLNTPVLANLLNGISSSYTPDLTHLKGNTYQIYAVFNGDNIYSKTKSVKVNYKIKKSFNLSLTVEDGDFYNTSAGTTSTYVNFLIECDKYTPDN